MKISVALLTFLVTLNTFASSERAWDLLRSSKGKKTLYPQIAKELIEDGLYFSAVPFIKEYLIQRNVVKNKELDLVIEKIVSQVGIKQFEVLPTKVLMKSNAPMMKYILAKKYFRLRKYTKALEEIKNAVPAVHPSKPFALFLEASILNIKKQYKTAISVYNQCITVSNQRISSENDSIRLYQYKITKDYCIVGISRAEFGAQKYDLAHNTYLDLPKSSPVWPEILFEEAWTSFYQRDYNRTLGKLVTYKAPVFTHIFNPENDVLVALTYLELCLWTDVKMSVDKFYKDYQAGFNDVVRYLKKHKKDYKYYFLVGQTAKEGRISENKLLNSMLKAITRDPSFKEAYQSLYRGRKELSKIKSITNDRWRNILGNNLKDSLLLQRNIVGAYVRKGLYIFKNLMDKSFEDMSYIKLEVLSQLRNQVLNIPSSYTRARGNLVNIKPNDKQYFWNFVGEFWADELGDYVFSLKSECK
jgi:tetratricopeptide (TPR) repeat protein